MNWLRVFSVFIILLGFALMLGLLLGLVFQVPYGNIAVIKITGEIINSDGSLMQSTTAASKITSQLREIKANPLIEAVIIDINSGGGSSVASDEIVQSIKSLDKPTIALIRDLGASGAYWVASACDYIIAHELSLVGSIGANMNYLEYSGLLKDYNISYVNLSYPEHKDMLSPYRELSDDERAWAEEWLLYAYDYLVSDIASNLGLNKSELLTYANGSLFIGKQALEYGLINELGGWADAYNKSIELANITEPIILEYSQSYSILDLLSGLSGESNSIIKT